MNPPTPAAPATPPTSREAEAEAATLARLAALLDEALDRPRDERPAWIAALPIEDAVHAPALARMLAAFESRGGATAEAAPPNPLDMPPMPARADPAATGPAFAAGDEVGPWKLVRPLGAGGMGEVWLAARADGQGRREVALKLPLLAGRRAGLVMRFERERDILAGLVHPSIARLYDAGIGADGQPYLALELVDGVPITAFCRERRLPARERIALIVQVAEAVQAAHAMLVVHRDLKPANVLVRGDGRAMLLDFGIAKLLDPGTPAAAADLTGLGPRPMTPAYAAPEQIEGAPVGIATDVWALGVLAYEVLAEARPFDAPTSAGLERAILAGEPPPLARAGAASALAAPRAAELAAVVGKALAKAPAARYPTADAFAADLRRWLAGLPVEARGSSRLYRAGVFVRRHRWPVAAGSLAVAAITVTAAMAVAQAAEARRQSERALIEARTAEAVTRFLKRIFEANTADQPDPAAARSRTAQQLLDDGAARLADELRDAPEARLEVLATMADLYVQLGNPDASLPLDREREALAARVHGEGSPAHLLALARLAESLTALNHLGDAATLLDRAERHLTAGSMRDKEAALAVDAVRATWHVYRQDGQGLEPARRVVAAARGSGAPRELASALHTLGSVQHHAGDHPAARATLEEALRVLDALGPRRAVIVEANVLGTLAETQMRLSDPDAAIATYRRVIALYTHHQGEAGRSTAMVRARLGLALVIAGRFAEARAELGALHREQGALLDTPERAEVLVYALGNASRAALAMGDARDALALAEASEAVAMRHRVESQSRPRTDLYRAMAERELGRAEAAARSLASATRRMQALKLERSLAAVLERERIAQLVAAGQGEAAWAALRQLTDPGAPQPWQRVQRQATEAETMLAAGHAADAMRAASATLAQIEATPTPGDRVLRARLRLVLAEARLAAGEAAAARDEASAAEDAFAAFADPAQHLGVAGARLVQARALAALAQRAEARRSLAAAEAVLRARGGAPRAMNLTLERARRAVA
jgi:serine/threonine-protein kinase